jgi:hypothetical protein
MIMAYRKGIHRESSRKAGADTVNNALPTINHTLVSGYR